MNIEEFRRSVAVLHRAKDAAYGNAWKRRGEVMSIMANIARKVDRLENLNAGAAPSPDESTLDTAVDLFVYLLKYRTYLGDLDRDVRDRLLVGEQVASPLSEGIGGFDHLLDTHDLTLLAAESVDLHDAIDQTVERFATLEACFAEGRPSGSTVERDALASLLVGDTLRVIGALRRQDSESFRGFVQAWTMPA